MLRTRAAMLFAIAVVSLYAPTAVHAAAPPSAPAVIVQRGFESGEPTLSIAPVQYSGDPATTAWWGVTPGITGALGSNALWCARTTPTGTRSYVSGYVDYTRGDAILAVNELQDYYSSTLAFRYRYESRASVDANAFTVRWHNVTTGLVENGPDSYNIPLASTWTTRTRDMSQGEVVDLSRDAALIEFEFFSRERATTTAYRGPAIDNVIVSGFKYGPVRSLNASVSAGTVALEWLKPYREIDEAVLEERPVAYRVWRAPAGTSSWSELTAARTTSASYVDTSGVPGKAYDYAVQAWDTGVGEGYGHLSMITATSPGSAPAVPITRIAGSDRYAVAVGIARAGWTSAASVTDVIIANGETGKEADPLAAAGLAGAYDAPVVLVQAGRLPAATKSYLTQVAAARKAVGKTVSVHIVGGTASVPDARWNEIKAIPGVSSTKHRIAGADRYAVTVSIANEIIKSEGIGAVNGVLIVNAENPAAFYDALAASPAAAAHTMPMLGVKAQSVPASVASALKGSLAGKPRSVVSAPAYVSAAVYGQVGATARLSSTTDRYASAASIATNLTTRFGATPSSVGIASALPDALTGGALVGKRGGVMLFTAPSSLPSSTRAWLSARKAGVESVDVLGGTASVTDGVKAAIASALK